MLDTSYYILRAQDRLPPYIIAVVEQHPVMHCSVALAEISITAGLLDPEHPGTRDIHGRLMAILEAIDLSTCRSPSPASWIEAGTLSGVLARRQYGLAQAKSNMSAAERCCQRGRRRELLNDVLLVLTARDHKATLLSANIADMDVMLRYRPDVDILLYRQTGTPKP